MRALLVSFEGVQEVEHTGSLESFYRLIDCDCMCSAGSPAPGHASWVDDEGMLTLQEGDQINAVTWHQQPLAGRIMVTGLDEHGDTTPATMSVEELGSLVAIMRIEKRDGEMVNAKIE